MHPLQIAASTDHIARRIALTVLLALSGESCSRSCSLTVLSGFAKALDRFASDLCIADDSLRAGLCRERRAELLVSPCNLRPP